MAELRLIHGWQLRDAAASRVEPALFELLATIEHHGSLQRAARELALSYRHAWGLVTDSTHMLGTALVKLERGRGATLTPLGKELLRLDRKAQQQLAPHFARIERELSAAALKHAARQPAKLRLNASHDLVLEYLREFANKSRRVSIELHFHGSLESLESFAHGDCDVAGFHLPERPAAAITQKYATWLKRKPGQLVHFVSREQGLVVARGNPKDIRGLGDLARGGVRFVNRQLGSGTRLLLDQLLAQDHVQPERVRGYQSEEFTHGAVAAMVASGVADAAFAIEAVARQLGLDFVPLARERYYLVVRDEIARDSRFAAFLEVLRSRKLRTYVAGLPGYDGTHCGEAATLAEVLRS